MSGHSKLPWQYRSDNLTSTTYWDIEDADHRILASTGMSRLNAEFIVKACNNYDTLKAKADLFDGLLTALESYHDQLTAIDAAMGLETNGRSSVDYLLSKAKELSK